MPSFEATYVPYRQTGAFSSIVLDYLQQEPLLNDFYAHPPTAQGIAESIQARKKTSTNREVLVAALKKQYESVELTEPVTRNIEKLLEANTFTVCTAHQPNILTGHLYFIYKILHAIKLSEELARQYPGNHFVPVYYMGSEDADIEELGEVVVNGARYQWQTSQQGAVGRMLVDASFLDLLDAVGGQLLVEPFGKEAMQMLREAYLPGQTIEQSTFQLVHRLFASYGLIVLLPDNPLLKKEFVQVAKKELESSFSYPLVQQTIAAFPEKYKVQAAGREINLFYLEGNLRERIERNETGFAIANTKLFFSREVLMKLLDEHPEKFSPNVILRPVFQEMILPNITFIGGGGELAYWLELKNVFEEVAVPFPVLILRNSFLFAGKRTGELLDKCGLEAVDFFEPLHEIQKKLLIRDAGVRLNLSAEKESLRKLYKQIASVSKEADPTLLAHSESLGVRALQKLEALEKKMLRAEKKRSEASMRQVAKVKEKLYPGGTLQERVDNLFTYYAQYGPAFISHLYRYSTGMQMQFCILEEKG